MIDTHTIDQPCPFCGEQPEQGLIITEHAGYYHVTCPTCGATGGPGKTPAGACERWNRRF